LQAIEEALQSSTTAPRRTLFLAYGHDEEIGGKAGAGEIAKHLQKKGVELEFVPTGIPGVYRVYVQLSSTSAAGGCHLNLLNGAGSGRGSVYTEGRCASRGSACGLHLQL
jgi:acetylornithine deacetylase/succinyl-diaminopimelate desuccinylase-like protein